MVVLGTPTSFDPMRRLIEEVTAAGGSAVEIPKTEVWRLLQAWRQVYCDPFREMKGPRGSHGWHAFSFGHFPSVRADRALREYRSQEPIDLLVLPDDKHTPGVCFTSDTIIEFSGWDDIYVAPRSFKWTMVFTHEDPEFGPYFAKAKWLARPEL